MLIFRCHAQANQRTPVLAEKSDPIEIERCDELCHPGDVTGIAVVTLVCWLIGFSKADKIWRNDAQSRIRKKRDHVPIEV